MITNKKIERLKSIWCELENYARQYVFEDEEGEKIKWILKDLEELIVEYRYELNRC